MHRTRQSRPAFPIRTNSVGGMRSTLVFSQKPHLSMGGRLKWDLSRIRPQWICGSAIVSALNPPQLSRNGSSGPRCRESLLADNFRVARDSGTIANVPRTIPPRTPPGFLLLQAKLFSRRQQCDRLANAPFARFRFFGCMNPNDEVTSVGGRQLPKELPGFGICLQRLGDVDR
jgi:hypothetical protein